MHGGRPVERIRRCLGESLDMYPAKDYIMRYLTYLLVYRLQFLALSYSLYSDGETWLDLEKSHSEGQALRWVSEGFSDPVVSLLGVEQPHASEPIAVVLA